MECLKKRDTGEGHYHRHTGGDRPGAGGGASRAGQHHHDDSDDEG